MRCVINHTRRPACLFRACEGCRVGSPLTTQPTKAAASETPQGFAILQRSVSYLCHLALTLRLRTFWYLVAQWHPCMSVCVCVCVGGGGRVCAGMQNPPRTHASPY